VKSTVVGQAFSIQPPAFPVAPEFQPPPWPRHKRRASEEKAAVASYKPLCEDSAR